MAPARIAAAGCALFTIGLAFALLPALSLASSAGGVEAPALAARELASGQSGSTAPPRAVSAALVGGSEYGVTIAAAGPQVGILSVPATAQPGRPPRVTLRVDEEGVGTVNVRVTVTDLAARRPVLVVSMGWIRTGRTVAVRWPRAARLASGTYHVSLVARDRNGANLLRRAHSSGVATLTVTAAPAPASATLPTGAALPEAGVATPAGSAAGAVFPVAGAHTYGGPENRFGAPRAGHTHQGQDVLTREGTPIVAPLPGVVVTTAFQAGGAGYYVVEHTGVGLDFMFAHCRAGSLAVAKDAALAAGQTLCEAGETGDATTPHLHFEVWVGGWQVAGGRPVDPLPYLQAWDHGA